MEMFRTTHLSLTVAALGFLEIAMVGVAHGTPPEAWAANETEVVAASAAASNLREAKPGGSLVDFADRVGFTAVVIDGRYPQPDMNNKRSRVLSLLPQRST